MTTFRRPADPEPHDDGTVVHLFKGPPPDVEPAAEDDRVLEGEIVDASAVRTALDVGTDLVRSPQAQLAARQGGYVVIGVTIVARRVRDSRTPANYERMLRAAEATGDHEMALAWADKVDDFRRDRHQRRMDLMELPVKVCETAPKVAIGGLGFLVGTGLLLAIGKRDASQVKTPFLVVGDITETTVAIVEVTWFPALICLPLLLLLILYVVGRRYEDASDLGWVGAVGEPDMDIQIDETTIARALEALRIPQITAYFKDDLPLQYITPARRDGRGTHAVIRLPAGVTAERIAARRADLASGLYRLAKEVWPKTGSEAGILDLWVADKGALEEGAGPYPLLESGFTDVFKGVPFGRILRGDPIKAPLIGRNTIVGGMPEQGKSSAARVIMAGAALDPTAELRIWVPDANYDFETFRPRCSRYVMGAEEHLIMQIRDDLLELHSEVQERGDLLVECREPEVTRAVADRVPGLHPLFCLLEEAHVAMNHKVHGDEISWLVTEIVRLGRKRAIHLIVSTQAPTAKSIPRDVTRNCSNGIAFAVGDNVANDALLGQGAYRAGHRATELIPGVDRGTALVKGFSGERSEIVQVHFLSVANDNDQVTPLIRRSLAEIKRRGRPVPGTGRTRPETEKRDLLEDLDEVLGAERIRLTHAIGALCNHAPQHAPYKALTADALRKILKDEGVATVKTGNVLYLHPVEVRKELAQRSTADLDDEG